MTFLSKKLSLIELQNFLSFALFRLTSMKPIFYLMLVCLQKLFFSLQTAVTEDSDSDVEDMSKLIKKSHCQLMHAENCVTKKGHPVGHDCVCIQVARFIHKVINMFQFFLQLLKEIKETFYKCIKLPFRFCGKIVNSIGSSMANMFKFL